MEVEIPTDNLLWLAHKNYESSLHALQAYGVLGAGVQMGHPHKHMYVCHHPSGGGIWSTLGNWGKKVFTYLKPHIAQVGSQLIKQGANLAQNQLAHITADDRPGQSPETKGSGYRRKIHY